MDPAFNDQYTNNRLLMILHVAGDEGGLVILSVLLGKILTHKTRKRPFGSKGNVFGFLLYFARVSAGCALCNGVSFEASAWHCLARRGPPSPDSFSLVCSLLNVLLKLNCKAIDICGRYRQGSDCMLSYRRAIKERRSFRSAKNVAFRRRNQRKGDEKLN